MSWQCVSVAPARMPLATFSAASRPSSTSSADIVWSPESSPHQRIDDSRAGDSSETKGLWTGMRRLLAVRLAGRKETDESPPRMQIEWDISVEMDDGVVLRADVFRPADAGRHPVILSYGPYAKGLSFQEGYKGNWARLTKAAPEVLQGSSNRYQNWELVDPEQWVPDGYACVRVDSRGAGRSPGHLDVWSTRETQDLYQCIEWAGTQRWSSGKVGINGISYYAMNQWQVAALKPPHLAALCIWEGASDYYRELCRHGGILCDFLSSWSPRQVASVQHGIGKRGAKSVVTGELVAGPQTLSDAELAKNRADTPGEAMRRRL